MAPTNTILRLSTTTSAINLQRLDPSQLTLQATRMDPAGKWTESTYTIASGDMSYPTTVVVRHTKANSGWKLLVAINSWAESADSVTGGVVRLPISAVITLNVPAMAVDVADLVTLLHNTFGFTFKSITAQVPDDTVVAGAAFGLTATLK